MDILIAPIINIAAIIPMETPIIANAVLLLLCFIFKRCILLILSIGILTSVFFFKFLFLFIRPEILPKIGYVFYQYGKKYESELYFYYLNTDIIKSIQLNRYLPFKYYDMAGSYAFFGKKEEAYRYLDEFAKRKFFPIRIVNFIKRDPLFDSLREEEEFKAIVKNVEAKYLKEHERVKVWLEQNEMP